MSMKRSATTDLNHDNWDSEEQKEEAGTFPMADAQTLQKRVIKTAKRRSPGLATDSKPNLFAGFSGFTKNTTDPSPFAFLAKKEETKTNGSEANKDTFKPFGGVSNDKKGDDVKDGATKEGAGNLKDLQLLKDLNVCCSNWIKEHVEKNPFCILTPIFKDYEQHLNKIKLNLDGNCTKNDAKEEKKDGKEMLPQESSIPKPTPAASTPLGFTFGTANAASASMFNTPPTNPPFAMSTFSTNVANLQPKPANDAEDTTGENEEEQQKYEFKSVVEQDSLFSMKCKVFELKESKDSKKEYISKGVGMLHLKPIKDSNKFQLVVRADTTLGNILLNVLLTDSLPIQKQGKNNVMLVCVPTPESKPPPVTCLIRVKTSDECDLVLKKIEECRGS